MYPLGEIRLNGYPISEGVALARVVFLDEGPHQAVPYYPIQPGETPSELERVRQACETASELLDGIIQQVTERIGPAQANIFVAQQLMVRDPALREEISALISEGHINAEAAIVKVLDRYESLLQDLDNEYLKERASDIGELRRRLLEILRGSVGTASIPPHCGSDPCIVVAEELTPTQTVSLDPDRTAGFITQQGGPASHAAILARAMGIPAVSGVQDVRRVLPQGERVLLDGSNGLVIVRPTQATLQVFPSAGRAFRAPLSAVPPVAGLEVMANINLSAEVHIVRAAQAEGIGLYRTEYECFSANRLLTEEEQYERYAYVVEAMEGLPVYFRLLDFGGDKAAAFLDIPHEENPCLGYRGARLLLGHPEILIPQARALARASQHGPVRVIHPMIATLEQFLVLREMFIQHTDDLQVGSIQHGVMFEVPSACLIADALFEVAEFGSVGSNDLIQYLFAVDRNNSLVAEDYSPDRPAFWGLLKVLSEAAEKKHRPLSLCGELGGQPQFLAKLLETGIHTVSMSPRLVGVARLAARKYLPG